MDKRLLRCITRGPFIGNLASCDLKEKLNNILFLGGLQARIIRDELSSYYRRKYAVANETTELRYIYHPRLEKRINVSSLCKNKNEQTLPTKIGVKRFTVNPHECGVTYLLIAGVSDYSYSIADHCAKLKKFVEAVNVLMKVRIYWILPDWDGSKCFSSANYSAASGKLRCTEAAETDAQVLKKFSNVVPIDERNIIAVQDDGHPQRGHDQRTRFRYTFAFLHWMLCGSTLGECCRLLAPLNERQYRQLCFYGFCFFLTMALYIYKSVFLSCRPSDSIKCTERLENFFAFTWALSKLGAIMIYFLLCDRSVLFEKKPLIFTWNRIWISCLVFAAAGLFTVRKSKNTGALNRDITREWKGWMQFYIVLYHYTNAFTIRPLYFAARICVSSYLFMSGFGHFTYYLRQANDMKESDQKCKLLPKTCHNTCNQFWKVFGRLLSVMIRLNLVTFSLCFVMNAEYLAHYFVPLVSFWVVAITAAVHLPLPICHLSSLLRKSNKKDASYLRSTILTRFKRNGLFQEEDAESMKISSGSHISNFFINGSKICTMMLFSICILGNKAMFKTIFFTGPLSHFISKARSGSWRFRLSIDRYTPVYGMLLALVMGCYQQFKSPNLTTARETEYSCAEPTGNAKFHSRKMTYLQLLMTSAGMIGLFLTVLYIFKFSHSDDTIRRNSYLVWIPILFYLLARNSARSLRSHYIWLFAWLGDISLEIYVGHSHILLTGNQSKTLELIPFVSSINLVISGWAFICISHELHQVTGVISKYLVPEQPIGITCSVFSLTAICLFLEGSIL